MSLRQYSKPLQAFAAVFSLVITFIGATTVAFASPVSISDVSGSNMAIDTGTYITASNWRYNVTASATATDTATPSNFSLVFNYVDTDNYSYVNVSSAAGSNLSGAYRVSGGVATRQIDITSYINPGQSYTLEVRRSAASLKITLDGAVIGKGSGLAMNNGYMGVSTLASSADFGSPYVEAPGGVTLSPELLESVVVPE